MYLGPPFNSSVREWKYKLEKLNSKKQSEFLAKDCGTLRYLKLKKLKALKLAKVLVTIKITIQSLIRVLSYVQQNFKTTNVEGSF